MNIMGVRYSTKKDVKYLKCVDDNCPGRATLKNGNTRITTKYIIGSVRRAEQELILSYLLFTALHGMQTRSYDEISVRLSVCLSVCLSVKRVHCDKTEERYV